MVDPVSAGLAIGLTQAALWAAPKVLDLGWDLTKGALGNEMHLRLREGLPDIYQRFTRNKLPIKHDLRDATRTALEHALMSFAEGLQATTDRNPSAFRKAMAYLRRGPEFQAESLLAQRAAEASWLREFRSLVRDDNRLLELEVITADTARELLAADVGEAARTLLIRSVQSWTERHLGRTPGRPSAWEDCLTKGWGLNAEDTVRVTLDQAWALHFQEAVKRKPDVFNCFVSGALADSMPTEVCANIAAALRGQLDALAAQLLGQLDRIEGKLEQLSDTTDQIHDTVKEIREFICHPEMRKKQFTELPAPPEHFIGRSAELVELVARLTQAEPGGHVITAGLLGMGGVGKTALALAVGHAVREHFSGGCLFFSLGAHSGEPIPGAQALRRWLELRAVLANVPAPRPDENLNVRFLQELAQAPGPVLVVVDDPAAEADLLPLRPRSGDGLLVTSRQALQGLHPISLPSLALTDAMALLRRLSNRHLSDIDAGALATSCANLPTALRALGGFLARRPNKPADELAAELRSARLPTLQKAAKGDAANDVHAVLQYSIAALDEDERIGLQSLCVMSSSFNRSLGAAVVGGDADLLDALGEAGVLEVQSDAGRYQLHDLMREVVLIATSAQTLNTARLRHAEWVQIWLDACNVQYTSTEPGVPARALSSFGAESAHLDSALAWLRAQNMDTELLPKLVWGLNGVGAKRMDPRERLPLYKAGAMAAIESGNRRAGAIHTLTHASLLMKLGDSAKAAVYAAEGLEVLRTLARQQETPSSQRDLAMALKEAGEIAQSQDEWLKAEALHREGLELCRKLAAETHTPQSQRDLSLSLQNSGKVAEAHCNWAYAWELYQESLTISRATTRGQNSPEARRDLSVSINKLGALALAIRRWDQADALLRESLEIRRTLASELNTVEARRDVSVSLRYVGQVAEMQGDWDQAGALYCESLEISVLLATELKIPELRRDVSVCLDCVGRFAQSKGDLPLAESKFSESLEIRRALAQELKTPGTLRDIGASLLHLAAMARQKGDVQASCSRLREAEPTYSELAKLLKTHQAEREYEGVLAQLAQDCSFLANCYRSPQ